MYPDNSLTILITIVIHYDRDRIPMVCVNEKEDKPLLNIVNKYTHVLHIYVHSRDIHE